MIDMHGVRIQAGLRNRIPAIIWVVLLLLAALSMAAVGYQSGLAGTRRSPTMLVLIVAFACVMYLITDLNRPLEGFITAGQQSLLDLQTSMKSGKP
jgi:tryptophan-rich sensory protein